MRKRRVAKPVREIRYQGLFDALDFMGVWSPPLTEFERSRSRWQTWDEFLAHYSAVREEFLAEYERLRAQRLAASQHRIAELEALLARDWNDHTLRLLDEARERLAGNEADVPGAELLYRRILAGETPEEAHQAVYFDLYGDEDESDGNAMRNSDLGATPSRFMGAAGGTRERQSRARVRTFSQSRNEKCGGEP